MQASFTIHGGWGNHISWSNKDFSKVRLDKDTLRVNGHMTVKPKVGDTLMGEFEKSFIKFEFVSVEYCFDPPDMFFGEVRAIEQEMKV